MAKNLEQIFEECLERIFQGESIESCIMRYPKEAASLEPLLRTVLGVSNRAATLKPDPEFKARARMRIDSAWHYAAQHKAVQKAGGFSWQRSWAFALSAIVLLLFGSVGTAFASAAAMPDEPLYGTKLATEQVQLALTFSEENKAALHASFAEQRAQEIATMAEEGKSDYLVATAAKLTYQMEQAESAIKRLELKEAAKPVSMAVTLQPPPPAAEPTVPEAAPAVAPAPTKTTDESALGVSANETVPEISTDARKTSSKKVKRAWEKLNQSTSKNLEVLEGALNKSADEDKPALKRVINKTRETRERTLKRRIHIKPERPEKPGQDKPKVTPEDQQPASEEQKPIQHELRPIEPQKPPEQTETPTPIPDTVQSPDTTNIRPYSPPTPVSPPKREGTNSKSGNTTYQLNNETSIQNGNDTHIIAPAITPLEIDRTISTSPPENNTK